MSFNSSLSFLLTLQDCKKLHAELDSDNVICLWATGKPIQSVEIMLYFKQILEKNGYKVVLLLRKSGKALFYHFCKNKNEKFVFECNDTNMFQWCPFIQILFTHDYCLQMKPKYFYGKIVLFPHNANTLYPSAGISLCADYIISSSPAKKTFSFKSYPNTIKKSSSKYQTIIPGNPKFDLLISKFNSNLSCTYHRVSFYPTALWISHRPLKILHDEYIKLINNFFIEYPQWEFILRPRAEDVSSELYISIKNNFKDNPNFILDTSIDNYKYLSMSDICITDYSGISKNFAFCSLRPIIRLHINDSYKKITKDNIGYFAYSADEVLVALRDALANLPQWNYQLRLVRTERIPYIGNTCKYICDHIKDILNDNKVENWINFNKYNTPSNTIKDYIKIIAHSDKELYKNPPAYMMTWSKMELGDNFKIALVAIKKYVSLWPQKYDYGIESAFKVELELAFNCAFYQHVIHLLKYMVKKKPKHIATNIFLAEALSRWQPYDPFLNSFVSNIIFMLPKDFFLCILISRILQFYTKASYTALSILELYAPGFHEKMPYWAYPIYAGLLFETKSSKLKEFITVWKGFYGLENAPLNLLIFQILEEASQYHIKIPPFFWMNASFNGTITNYIPKKAFPIAKTIIKKYLYDNPNLGWAYIQLAALHSMSNEYNYSIIYIYKAIEMQPDVLLFRNDLANIFFKTGDLKEVKKIATEALAICPDQSWAYIQLANVHNAYNEFDDAIACTKKAIEVQPHNLGYRDNLATCLLKKGKLDKVEKIAREALKILPNQGWAYIQLANVHNARNQLDDAIACARKAIEVQPNILGFRNNLAAWLFRKGDFDEVEKVARDALEILPNQGWAYIQLANIHSARNQLDDAIACARKAIEVQPNVLGFRDNLATWLFKKGHFDEVEKIARDVLDILPNQGWAYIQLANIHSARNEIDDAILYIRKAIEVQPSALGFRNNLATWLFKKGDFEAVEKLAREALEILPTQGWAYIHLANLHNVRNEIDDAIACTKKAIEVQPNILGFRDNLATWLFKKGDFDEVEKIAREALEILPYQGWAYIQLANVHNARNQLDDAIACTRKAIEVQPHNLGYRDNLATCLLKKGKLDEVKKIVREALEILPNQGWAYIQLANVHNARNQLDDAIACARKAIEVQPNILGFRNNLATWLLKKGYFDEVEKIARDTLEILPNQGWAYIQLANVHNARNQLDDAIACARKAIEVQPNVLGFRDNLATWLFKKGHFDEVEKIARDALEISPNQGWAYIQLANIHNARTEIDDAIACTQKAIEVQPNILGFRNNLAAWLLKKGSFDEVEKIARDALEIFPNQGWAYIQLANVHNARNEIDNAIVCTQKAIEVQPDAIWFRNTLAEWLRKKGELVNVEDIACKTLAVFPNQGWAYIQLANVHSARNELDDAIVAVQKAIEVQPDALHFRNNLAGLYFKKGDFEQIEKIANDALAILPNQGWAYIQLSNIHNVRNEPDDAIAAVQKAIEVQPDALHFRNNLAGLFFKKGDYETVIKIVNEALAILPNQGWAYIQLANVHNARNELDEAIACIRKAIEIQPDALHFRNNLAGLLFKKGNLEEVEQLAYDTLSISPIQGWAYIQLANVHDARNELEDAILCIQKAIEVQPDAVHYHKTLEKLLHKQESARAKVTQ